MRQINSIPISSTNALYYEAKLREFVFFLIERQKKISNYIENGVISESDRQAINAVMYHLDINVNQPLSLGRM